MLPGKSGSIQDYIEKLNEELGRLTAAVPWRESTTHWEDNASKHTGVPFPPHINNEQSHMRQHPIKNVWEVDFSAAWVTHHYQNVGGRCHHRRNRPRTNIENQPLGTKNRHHFHGDSYENELIITVTHTIKYPRYVTQRKQRQLRTKVSGAA